MIEMEFYYDEILIGVGYGLNEGECNFLWEEWESFGDEYWCMEVFREIY